MNLSRTFRVLVLSGVLTASIGMAATAGAASDNSHTPVTLCHWVPAHGGSYVIITVDDDASTGNKNGKGHMGHDDDIIPANPDGTCGAPDPDLDLD